MTYDPNIGRWLEEDPDGFDAGDTNLYRLEENNPANAVDPTGMNEIKSINFTWYGFNSEQRGHLNDNTWLAIIKLEKALAMLTEYWSELHELAEFKPAGASKSVLDSSYRKLREEVVVTRSGLWILPDLNIYLSPREVYTNKIKRIFSQIKCGQHLEFRDSSYYPGM